MKKERGEQPVNESKAFNPSIKRNFEQLACEKASFLMIDSLTGAQHSDDQLTGLHRVVWDGYMCYLGM